MGTTTTPFFPEIYLQKLGNTKIMNILVQHHIIGYFQFADILIFYLHNATNIQVLKYALQPTEQKLSQLNTAYQHTIKMKGKK
jgi:hypothetical protein